MYLNVEYNTDKKSGPNLNNFTGGGWGWGGGTLVSFAPKDETMQTKKTLIKLSLSNYSMLEFKF